MRRRKSQPIRDLVGKRLMPPKRLEAAQRSLDQMLLTLWTAGYVTLEPHPPLPGASDAADRCRGARGDDQAGYRAELAHPTPELPKLLQLRGVNPLYGIFVINQLGIADTCERLQALESILEMPGTVARYVRVPGPDQLPPGPLAVNRLDAATAATGAGDSPRNWGLARSRKRTTIATGACLPRRRSGRWCWRRN